LKKQIFFKLAKITIISIIRAKQEFSSRNKISS